MSLRHASKVLFRAAQAVRVATRQPAPTRAMPGAAKPGSTAPAAHHRQQGAQSSVGGLTGVSAEKTMALETARRRKAVEKAEKAVHLVCWGPN